MIKILFLLCSHITISKQFDYRNSLLTNRWFSLLIFDPERLLTLLENYMMQP